MRESIVQLSPGTAEMLRQARFVADVETHQFDAGELSLDHVRLNVLMRKGLVDYVAPGRWRVTPRGRSVEIIERPVARRGA